MFGITNLASNKLITSLDVPHLNDKSFEYYYEPPYYNFLKAMLNAKVRYRPGSKYEFASYSTLGAVVQIFRIDTNYNFHIKYEKVYYLPSFSLIKGPGYTKPIMSPGRKFGFNDVTVTKDKIYTLFNGPELTKLNVYTDVLLVYDWNGHALNKFTLDRKCRNIAIDENNPKLMYAIYGDREVHIVKYQLP
jgi:hypothetical protein